MLLIIITFAAFDESFGRHSAVCDAIAVSGGQSAAELRAKQEGAEKVDEDTTAAAEEAGGAQDMNED